MSNSILEERAWAAGFFEGEGSWSYYVRRPDYPLGTMRASLSQKGSNGKGILEKFQKIVGFGRVFKCRRTDDPETGMYNWQCNRIGEPEKLFTLIGEWLSPRRINRYHELNNKQQQDLISFPKRKPGLVKGFKRDTFGKVIKDVDGNVIR